MIHFFKNLTTGNKNYVIKEESQKHYVYVTSQSVIDEKNLCTPYRNQGPNASPKWAMHCFFALILQNQKTLPPQKDEMFPFVCHLSIKLALRVRMLLDTPSFNGGLPVFATIIFASRLRDPFTDSYSAWLSLPQTRFD